MERCDHAGTLTSPVGLVAGNGQFPFEFCRCARERGLKVVVAAHLGETDPSIKELAEQLSEYISAPIYKTYIRSAVAVEEAQANRADIFDYAGKSTVADDYRAFIKEFLEEVNV